MQIATKVHPKLNSVSNMDNKEDTPAYKALSEAKVLCTDHRRSDIESIFTGIDLKANSSKTNNISSKFWNCGFCCPCIYYCFHSVQFVPANHIGFAMNDKNEYLFLQSGMHLINGWTISVSSKTSPLRGHIRHGNRTVVIIEQGHIGYATDNGQPVLLPPGIHVWTSESLDYVKSVALSDHLIHLGPYTIVTVDEGYVAITQNNGKQIILEGGNAYFLNHINWKFQKFMSMKIQTDDIKETIATSADNIDLAVQSTVIWRITDAKIAATMAAETMTGTGMGQIGQDIAKLRNDVLKQALASLSAFVGSVNYSGSFSKRTTPMREPVGNVQVVEGKKLPSAPAPSEPIKYDDGFMENPIYDVKKMENAMDHANIVTCTYGVEIMSINIITAFPKDPALSKSLASGAVAAAEALQLDIDIKSKSKALKMEAIAQAEAEEIKARGQASAELIKANASKDSAVLKAEGEAEAIKKISKAMETPGGASAMQQQLAIQYLDQYAKMTSTAKTIIIPDKPNDVSGVLATAMGLKGAMQNI